MMAPVRLIRLTRVLPLLGGVLAACANGAEPGCNGSLVQFPLVVLDSTDAPFTPASILSIQTGTGDTLFLSAESPHPTGVYVILTNQVIGSFGLGADSVLVSVRQADSVRATTTFTFRTPDRCVLERVSGPDTLIIGP